MHYQYVPYLLLSVFSAVICFALALYAWINRKVRNARLFLLIMLLVINTIVTQALEFSALQLHTKIFWANMYYFSTLLLPVVYLALVIHLTGREAWFNRRWFVIVLLTIPLVFFVLLWSNDLHGLVRQDVYLDTSGSFPVVGKTFGPLFWPFAVYNFSVTFLSIALLAQSLLNKALLYRAQIALLFVGILLPTTSTFLAVFGILPFRFDLTPLAFGFSGLIISWGIFRHRLFDVVPVARSMIIENMTSGVVVLEGEGRIVDINRAAVDILAHAPPAKLFGLPAEEAFGGYPELLRLYLGKKTHTGELVINKEGIPQYYEVTYSQLTDMRQRPLGWLLQIYNITERKNMEELIRHTAYHDQLTGLQNRTFFYELFTKELNHATRRNEKLVVAFIDLDGFKEVNDSFGHETGDYFLCEVARRLKGAVRNSDVVARLGGDEFALLLPGIKDDAGVKAVARKIFHAFSELVAVENNNLRIKASIGFSSFPADGDNIEKLLQKADAAMYTAKKSGKNRYHISA